MARRSTFESPGTDRERNDCDPQLLVPQERLLLRKGYDAVMVLGTDGLIAHTEIGKCSAVALRREEASVDQLAQAMLLRPCE